MTRQGTSHEIRRTFRAKALFAAAAMLAFVFGGAAAAPAALTDGPLVGNYAVEQPVAITDEGQVFPSISGNYIVWEVWKPSSEIVLYNRATQTELMITNQPDSLQWRPNISGNRVVWMDRRSGDWEIYWYDIAANIRHRLTTDPAEQSWPEISGDKVVWMDYRWNVQGEVVVHDFKTGATTRLTNDDYVQQQPRISGNRVVWADQRSGNFDIWWYDLVGKHEYQLTNDPGDETEPVVSGSSAAWTMNGTYAIGVAPYFATSGLSRTSIGGVTDCSSPRIYGDIVVYRHGSQVGLYSISKGKYYTLTTTPGHAYAPFMWKDTVVWFDDRAGVDKRDVYAARLLVPSLTLTAPSWIAYDAPVKVSGYLKNWDGTPLANRDVAVSYFDRTLRQGIGWWFPTSGYVKTDVNGKFTASFLSFVPNAIGVRASYIGGSDSLFTLSPERIVLPQVYLGTPSAPTSISRYKSFTSTGRFRPNQPDGASALKIKCYRKESGVWKWRRTYSATIYHDGVDCRYKATVKLPLAGAWRIRAEYPTTSLNYKTYSGFRYVTSK